MDKLKMFVLFRLMYEYLMESEALILFVYANEIKGTKSNVIKRIQFADLDYI